MAYKQSATELQEHLADQLDFLQASSESYDRGFDAEAKRIAHTVRLLLHDTPSSTSLLMQLGTKNRDFFDTCLPDEAGNLLTHGGLVWQALEPGGIKWIAQLSDVPVCGWKPVESWWSAQVFRGDQGELLTRRELVLAIANKDGGSHVDPVLSEKYARLSRQNALAVTWTEQGVSRQATGPERAAMRQVAHEVLVTLVPGYSCQPAQKTGIIVGGMTLIEGAVPESNPGNSSQSSSQLPVDEGRRTKRQRRRDRGRHSTKALPEIGP